MILMLKITKILLVINLVLFRILKLKHLDQGMEEKEIYLIKVEMNINHPKNALRIGNLSVNCKTMN